MFLDHCEKEEIHSQDTLLGEVHTVHTSVVHDVLKPLSHGSYSHEPGCTPILNLPKNNLAC